MQNELNTICAQHTSLCAYGFGPNQAGKSNPIEVKQFELCVDYLRQSGLSRRQHSYGIKHCIEAATGQYVSNGALIAAAVYLSFDIRPDGPNAHIRAA